MRDCFSKRDLASLLFLRDWFAHMKSVLRRYIVGGRPLDLDLSSFCKSQNVTLLANLPQLILLTWTDPG